MSKEKTKEWNNISELTENWVKESYPKFNSTTSWKYKDILNTFFKFLGTTDKEFIESYKRAQDKNEWAKSIGLKAVAFYNQRLKEGYATNTARAEVSAVRAFCRDKCVALILPRKKIAKAKAAKGEHEFTREELAKMYHVADVRDKAILSTAISLGFSIEDFSELPRDLIENLVNKATSEKIDFIGFDFERGKTGVSSRSHLTPEARDSLRDWFEYIDKKRASEGKGKSAYVFPNGNDHFLTGQAINDVIKNLVAKANIITTGTVRFHLLRKFLMNALHDAGFSDWEVKRAVGKEIPTTDSTYLQGLSRQLSAKFPQVYDFIKLGTYTNKNGMRIDQLVEENRKLKEKVIDQDMRIEALLTRLEELDPKVREKYDKTLELLRAKMQAKAKEELEEIKAHE
jgi:site-specific recombinase XerD